VPEELAEPWLLSIVARQLHASTGWRDVSEALGGRLDARGSVDDESSASVS